MFGLFRHVGKNQRGEQKKVCDNGIPSRRSAVGDYKPPNYSPSPDCNPSKRSSRSFLSAASRPHTQMCVSQSGRALAAGGELARPITTATASAGGSGDHHKVWSLLPLCCSRHRWPKTKARLCETSLLRALGAPQNFWPSSTRGGAGLSCANGRATLFWDFTPHGIYEDRLHIEQSLLPLRRQLCGPGRRRRGGRNDQTRRDTGLMEKGKKDR